MNKYFPLFADIRKKDVLILGGNEKAAEKILKLIPYGAKITVIAKDFCKEVCEIKGVLMLDGDCNYAVTYIKRCLPYMVILADKTAFDSYDIFCICKNNSILLNTVDNARRSNFIFSVVVSGDNHTIAVSSNGICPVAAVKIRECISESLPDNLDEILEQLKYLRPILYSESGIPGDKVKTALKEIVDEAFLKDRPLTTEEIENTVKKYREQL